MYLEYNIMYSSTSIFNLVQLLINSIARIITVFRDEYLAPTEYFQQLKGYL